MPALRTKDTLVRSLEVTTTLSPSLSSPTSSSCAPMLAIISPTPRAFTFPINHNLEDSPYSTPSSSPFQPELSLAGGLGGVGGGLEPFYTHTQGGNGGNGNGAQTVLLPSPMSSTPPPRTLSPSVLSTPSSSCSNTSNILSSPITGSSTSSLTQTHKRRKSSHSVDPTERGERRPKKGDEDYIKRPENAFILFRRKCCEERDAGSSTTSTSGSNASSSSASDSTIPSSSTTVSSSSSSSSIMSSSPPLKETPKDAPVKKQRQADLSKTISQQWKSLAPEERAYWEELAKEKKREHERMYPNYVYRPQRSKSKANSNSSGSMNSSGNGKSGSGEGRSGREGGEKKERTGKKGREVSKERGSVGKVDEDDAESKDHDGKAEKDKEERISFVVPLLPSHTSHHHTLSIGGGGGGGFYNSRPHGRSISAPTPPPVPQFQQYLYAPQQVQQHMLGGGGNGGQQQQQQQISIPNVYSASMPNSPHASFSSAFNPNASFPASSSVYSNNSYANANLNMGMNSGMGGMLGGGMGVGMMRSMSLSEGMPLPGMLPTSPTSDVPMISGTGRRSSHSGVTTPAPPSASLGGAVGGAVGAGSLGGNGGVGFESSDFLRGMYSMGGDAPSSSSPTSTSTSSTSSSTPTPSSASTTSVSASSQAGSAHRQLSPLATIALAHSHSSSHSNNGNGISPASSGPSTPLSAFSPFSSLSLSPSSASTTSSGLVHAFQQSSLNDFASHSPQTPFTPFSSHLHDNAFNSGVSSMGSMGMGFTGGLAGMGAGILDDGLYGGDMNVCGGGSGRGYDDETSHWTQMQNALNGNGVFDYTNPAERFVEPAPHSHNSHSHVTSNNSLLNSSASLFNANGNGNGNGGGSFGAQSYGSSGGYDGMYGFNKGLDAFSFSSSMSSMDVDMFNSSTSHFPNPSFPTNSSSHFPNTEDGAHGASEAEMAAYEWEHSPTSFSSSSTGFTPDDFDISAIPPIEIGLPKFGGSGELSYGMGTGEEHTQHGVEGEGVNGGEVREGREAREAVVSAEVV